jgi:G:T/U-mismatch repair DNA glycosylase
MIEYHPLKPFLPANARVLFLGSFPPPQKRWCMDFFYPNFINDHWRIEGEIWFGDRNHFVDTEHKCFKKDEIVAFLNEKGIAFFDTATAVKRLKDNASDAFLEIVEHTDIWALLSQMPQCHAIATTGEKSTTEVCAYYNVDTIPSPNSQMVLEDNLILYRLPSSSRAYPLSFDKKVEAYRKMFEAVFGTLQND